MIHEIDKIIDGLEKALRDKQYDFASKILTHLKNIVLTYKKTIKIDKKADTYSLAKIVDQAIVNFQYRFDSHHIEVETMIPDNLSIKTKFFLVIGAIINILDNAVYWLKEYKIKSKKIAIKAYQVGKEIHVLIADNGHGFNMSFESAKGAFITGRFDDSSMGIGLYLVDQIMQAHHGELSCGNVNDERLPDEFRNGAILKLIFRTEL